MLGLQERSNQVRVSECKSCVCCFQALQPIGIVCALSHTGLNIPNALSLGKVVGYWKVGEGRH